MTSPHPYHVGLRTTVQEELLNGVACLAVCGKAAKLPFKIRKAEDLHGGVSRGAESRRRLSDPLARRIKLEQRDYRCDEYVTWAHMARREFLQAQ